MPLRLKRICLSTSVLVPLLFAATAAQARPQRFSVPAQAAATGIPQFARQAGLQILVSEDLVRAVRVHAVSGLLEPRAALTRLLEGSGLAVVATDGTVVTLGRAAARPAPAATTGGADDAIVVTGTALQNQEAIDSRRTALGVMDVLAQDDTGDLADQSLAEALSRVPAVSTMQVLYGEQESQYVAVRGITPDLNFVSLDGIGMISVANGGAGQRRVDLALIPSQAARKTEVFKTFSADQDSGAIGGIINIVPFSAMQGKQRFYIDSFASYITNDSVPGGNSRGGYADSRWGGGIKGLLTRRFGADGQFGLVLSGTYRQQSYDDVKRNPNGRTYYTADGTATTPDSADYNGFDPAPQAMVDYEFTSFVKTYGGTVMLEYQPTPDWYVSLLGYDYKQTEDQTNNTYTLRAFTGLTDQTPHGGTLRVPDVRTAINYDRFENESRGLLVKARHDFDAATRMELRAGYNDNSFYDRENANVYQYKPSNLFIDYDTSGKSVAFALHGADLAGSVDPANFRLYSANDTLTRARGKAYEGRLDFSRNFEADSLGLGYRAGVGARRFELDRNLDKIVYTSDKSSLAGHDYVPENYIPWMWGYPVLWVDNASFRNSVLPGLGVNAASTASSSAASDYRYGETIDYAYVSGTFATERSRLIAGVRMDQARFTADVPVSVGGVYTGAFQRYSGDYGYFLPSASLLHDFSDRFRLKAGYSRTLGRPAPEDIAQAELRNDTSYTISRGNPGLRPRRSDNFDLTFERYFNGSKGLFSIGAFYKAIKDDIYELKQEQLIDGITYTISTPMNANSSKMRGVEVQYINNAIRGLPGFLRDRVGLSLNATRIWGSMDYLVDGAKLHVNRLLYQRNWMANAALFYRLPRDGEFRIGYNWGDEYYDGIGADPWLHRGPQGRGQMDASIRLRVARNWIVKAQAKNILNEDLYLGYGAALSMRRAEMKKGRTFFLNLIYRP